MSEDLTPKRDYMDGANINWRHEKPNYDLVNAKYLKERKSNIKAGSIAKLVEDLVKTWEMESSHKMSEKDWGSVDAKKFTLSANGGKVFNLADNIELGNYNMMMESSILWNPMSNQDSHDIFRSALPGGFAWELTELLSGPPNVSFTWRHWGNWEGKYLDQEPTGEEIELFGHCIVRVNDDLKVLSIEVFYDPNPMMAKLTGFDKTGVCPFAVKK